MTVVSNTSPIINLAAIGQLDLLRERYTTIHIPDAVYREITVYGAGRPGDVEVRTSAWVVRRTVADSAYVERLRRLVDRGEAEAIVLAQEMHADWLLIDELLGRDVAAREGLRFTGVIGVLLAAKRSGLLSVIRPSLDALRANDFWIGQRLYHDILRRVGEI